MGIFVKGDIVVLSYPFSDFSGAKRRPALVIADLDGDDIILCQITSQAKIDKYALKLEEEDFTDGKLSVKSVVRPNKIFTADSNIILYTACKISGEKTDIIIKAIMDIMNPGAENKRKGKIIFLNGVSSSGKTTLAKTLQGRLSEPFFLLNMDAFAHALRMPEKFYDGDWNSSRWNQIEDKIVSSFHQTIKIFSDMGFHTVVDRVFSRESLTECVELFHDYIVLLVHVTCPLEELRRREKERGDRYIGQSEEQLLELSEVVMQGMYDITVDTHADSSEKCAEKIIEILNHPEKWTAFETLWGQMQSCKKFT